jgi:hypothetical protein
VFPWLLCVDLITRLQSGADQEPLILCRPAKPSLHADLVKGSVKLTSQQTGLRTSHSAVARAQAPNHLPW